MSNSKRNIPTFHSLSSQPLEAPEPKCVVTYPRTAIFGGNRGPNAGKTILGCCRATKLSEFDFANQFRRTRGGATRVFCAHTHSLRLVCHLHSRLDHFRKQVVLPRNAKTTPNWNAFVCGSLFHRTRSSGQCHREAVKPDLSRSRVVWEELG